MNNPTISTTLANGVVITAPNHLVAQALIALATPGSKCAHGSLFTEDCDGCVKQAIRPGDAWANGDIYLGVVFGENGGPDYHLTLPTDPAFSFEGVSLGTNGVYVDGANHKRDGLANTVALANAGSNICKRILQLGENVYLPSQFEAYLIYAYAQEHVEKVWHITSSQYSAGCAFAQTFYAGYQGFNDEGHVARARAVRRFVIQ